MKLQPVRAAMALAILSALLFVSAPLTAEPAGSLQDPPIETSPTDESVGSEDPSGETDLGPAADPDGLSAGAPAPDGGASTFVSWLRSLFGGILGEV